MKSLIRVIFINLISLLIVAHLTNGIIYQNNILTLLIAAGCLFLLNLVVKPLLNLIFMPINLLTLGAARWLINILLFWGVTLLVDNFTLVPISLPQANLAGYMFPGLSLSFFWSLVLLSLLVQLCISLISWICK